MARHSENPTQSMTTPIPLVYRAIRQLVRLLVTVFYRRIETAGLEHVPARGPLILAATHQNALIDPMLLIAIIPRRMVPLAKAPLFRTPVIGGFLRAVGAIPVHRRQDSPDGATDNREMFRQAAATLARDTAILIFPEGRSQPEPALMPLRTGAARILLQVQSEIAEPVTLLPIGLVYHEPGTFRAARAWILVGESLDTSECVARYGDDPEGAVRLLTERLTEALRTRIVEADDRQTLRLLTTLESMWRQETPDASRDAAAQAARMRGMMRAYRYLALREDARVARFRDEVERYAVDLELTGFAGAALPESYPAAAVFRYALREIASLVVGFPLAVWGIVNHFLPYQITRLIVNAAHPEADVEATYKLVGSLILYPVIWLAETLLVWRFAGGGLALLFAASLLPTGFFAITWRERLHRFIRDTAGFIQFLTGGSLRRRLIARRRELIQEMEDLARLVPEEVMADPTPER
jgi:glycerol-3-phosphate O-acyltransferase/dihydroxyacetone phosphate acyltransferase